MYHVIRALAKYVCARVMDGEGGGASEEATLSWVSGVQEGALKELLSRVRVWAK